MQTITRALAELKLLDKRINKEINSYSGVDVMQQKLNLTVNTKKNKADFEKESVAGLQSIKDLIENRRIIKSKIIKSNAKTKVKINNKDMTVAEAIEMKTSIEYDTRLLNTLKQQFTAAKTAIDKTNIKLDSQIEQMLLSNYGKDRKATPEDYEIIAKPLRDANELKMVDAINIEKVIKNKEEQLDKFLSEVDLVLSESNARTEV